jgi:cytochrome b involved in lipid metabolism
MTYVNEDDKVTLTGNDDDQDDDDRPMNDTTMPPPSSAAVASRTSNSTASSATATAVVKPPGVAIRPRPRSSRHKAGFGLADWNRLVRTSRNLAMRADPKAPLRRSIPWSEIQTHNSAVHDGWVVLRGKVYNLSPYLDYHPGGARILQKIVGKDITALYDQYHRWVNEEGYVRSACWDVVSVSIATSNIAPNRQKRRDDNP